MIGVSLVLVELEARFNGLDRHLDGDNRSHQHRAPLRRQHAVGGPGRLWREPGFELRHKTIEMVADMVGRDHVHRPGQLHRLIEPGGHLLRTRAPERRYVGVVAGNSDRPWSTLGRALGEWIDQVALTWRAGE